MCHTHAHLHRGHAHTEYTSSTSDPPLEPGGIGRHHPRPRPRPRPRAHEGGDEGGGYDCQLRKLFDRLDTSGDGVLSKAELVKAIRRAVLNACADEIQTLSSERELLAELCRSIMVDADTGIDEIGTDTGTGTGTGTGVKLWNGQVR